MEFKPIYLVMVTAGKNNNKYYRMIPHGDTWTAEYGRVGYEPQRRTYNLSSWNTKYHEKLRKGYVDQSDLIEDLISVESSTPKSQWKEIENPSIAKIVERLQTMARKAVYDNYNISSNKVTQAMVEEAQKSINDLMSFDNIEAFNNQLLSLFTIIPRKMYNVKSYLSDSQEDFSKIIKREQDLLDVMRGQVIQKKIEDDCGNSSDMECEPQKTILEAMGLEFYECSDQEISMIRSLLGSCSNKLYNAWKVINQNTQSRFDQFVQKEKIQDCKLLWHGSRNENWWSIINTGLVLKPTNAVINGKMFGYGIYYAPKAQKSLGYTSLAGSYWAKGNDNAAFMALMNVAYGKPYDVYSFDSKYYSFNYEKLKEHDKNANCLHAHAGSMLRNDEIIVYKEEQCTIQYLVELR